MTHQTNAQRLADALLAIAEDAKDDPDTWHICHAADEELRRLSVIEQRHNEMLASPCPEWDNKAYMQAIANLRERLSAIEQERDQLRGEADQFRALAKANADLLGEALAEIKALKGGQAGWEEFAWLS